MTSQTDVCFIHKFLKKDANRAVVFFSGIGMPIKKQREVFLRKASLKNKVSYLALDCTKRALFFASHHFEISSMATEGVRIIREQFPNERLTLIGPCFGGNIALKVANQLPDQTDNVLLLSPLIEYEKNGWFENVLTRIKEKVAVLKEQPNSKEEIRKLLIFYHMWQKTNSILQPEVQTYLGAVHVLHGECDHMIPRTNSEMMCRVLNRPNVCLNIIPHDTHSLDLDYQLCRPVQILNQVLSRQKS